MSLLNCLKNHECSDVDREEYFYHPLLQIFISSFKAELLFWSLEIFCCDRRFAFVHADEEMRHRGFRRVSAARVKPESRRRCGL